MNTAVSFDSSFSAINGVTVTVSPYCWYKPASATGSVRGLSFAMEQRSSSGRGVPATFLFIFKSDSAPLFTIIRKNESQGFLTSGTGYLADIYPSEIIVTESVNVTTQTATKIEFNILQLTVLRRICEAPSFRYIKNDQWTGFQVYFIGRPLEDEPDEHETLARDLCELRLHF